MTSSYDSNLGQLTTGNNANSNARLTIERHKQASRDKRGFERTSKAILSLPIFIWSPLPHHSITRTIIEGHIAI
jgi:hypothetical protein